MKKTIYILFLSCLSLTASAQTHYRPQHPTLTYDLGISTGTYNDHSYSEITAGLNWFLQDYLAWRNAIFSRSGSNIDSAAGLDTSARFIYNSPLDERGFGLGVFAGPGLRVSNKENSGVFGEAGATIKMGGLAIGGGVKSIQYSSPRKDSNGNEFPKNDTVVFLILGGGGAL